MRRVKVVLISGGNCDQPSLRAARFKVRPGEYKDICSALVELDNNLSAEVIDAST